jgi:hypothetical protein
MGMVGEQEKGRAPAAELIAVRPPQKPLIFYALIIEVALLYRLIFALARNGDPQEQVAIAEHDLFFGEAWP